jgi:hypothetical protein
MEYKWPQLGEQFDIGVFEEIVRPESTQLNLHFDDPQKISPIFDVLKGHQIHLETEAYEAKLKKCDRNKNKVDTKLQIVAPARRLIDADELKRLSIEAAVLPGYRHK